MKKRLIILFDEYPFRPAEYSFVRRELEELIEHFNVSIISLSPSTEQEMTIDRRITLYHCIRKFGVKEKVEAVIKFLFSRQGFDEIKRILKSGQNMIGCLYDSLAFFSSADQLCKYVKRNHIIRGDELVYSYWFNANCLAFLMNKKKYPEMKVVSRIHNYDLYNERSLHNRQPFKEYMDEAVDKIFFVADAGLQYYIQHWGSADNIGHKYIIARIGSICDSFCANYASFEKKEFFRIVSCSHVIPLKRVNLIIDGLAEITDFPVSWIHFGAGTHYEETTEYARKKLSDNDNISYEMPGFVPVEEIMKFYAEHYVDCFLTATSVEGSPVSIQEAMAYGIPIIATAVGEIPNMIVGNGILLSENPLPEEIVDAIKCLYKATGEEVQRMREASRKIWENKYNAVKNAKMFVELLNF